MATKAERAEVTRDHAEQAQDLSDTVSTDKDIPKEAREKAAKLIEQAADILNAAAEELEE